MDMLLCPRCTTAPELCITKQDLGGQGGGEVRYACVICPYCGLRGAKIDDYRPGDFKQMAVDGWNVLVQRRLADPPREAPEAGTKLDAARLDFLASLQREDADAYIAIVSAPEELRAAIDARMAKRKA